MLLPLLQNLRMLGLPPGGEATGRRRKASKPERDWRKESREHLREQLESAFGTPIVGKQEIQAMREAVVAPKPVSAGWDDDEEALLLMV